MAIPADRVARILGLRANVRSVADIAEAVESGLPKHSLERVVDRAGIEGLPASSSCIASCPRRRTSAAFA